MQLLALPSPPSPPTVSALLSFATDRDCAIVSMRISFCLPFLRFGVQLISPTVRLFANESSSDCVWNMRVTCFAACIRYFVAFFSYVFSALVYVCSCGHDCLPWTRAKPQLSITLLMLLSFRLLWLCALANTLSRDCDGEQDYRICLLFNFYTEMKQFNS